MKEKLKKLRLDAHFSQDFLARELGVSKSCISAWENGKRSPDTKNLISYIRVFDLEPDFFEDDITSKMAHAQKCFDMTVLNVRGAKKLYDFYLSLLEDEENLKKS